MIYLVCGNQSPMIRKRVNKIAEASLNNEIDNMNYAKYAADDVGVYELLDEVMLLPLGYDKKVIVYENTQYLLKSSKLKYNEDEERALLDYLDHENESADLIFACHGEVNKSSKLYIKISRLGKIYEIADPQKNEWVDYVKRYCVDVLKLQIDNDAIYELASRTKNDAASLINNAEKLSLFTNHIRYQDVDLMVTRPLEDNIFRIFDALLNRKNADAVKIFRDLIEVDNTVVNKIINILGGQFRLLNEVSFLLRNRMSDEDIMEHLKLKDWKLKDLKRKAYAISQDTILNTLDRLYELDSQIKSGIIGYEYRILVFELFLINFEII